MTTIEVVRPRPLNLEPTLADEVFSNRNQSTRFHLEPTKASNAGSNPNWMSKIKNGDDFAPKQKITMPAGEGGPGAATAER